MSKHLLDKADVRAVLQHQRRHGVAEQMAATHLIDVSLFDVFLNRSGYFVRIEHLAGLIQEHIVWTGWQGMLRSHIIEVFFDPDQGAFSNRHKTILFALALSDGDDTGAAIDILFG